MQFFVYVKRVALFNSEIGPTFDLHQVLAVFLLSIVFALGSTRNYAYTRLHSCVVYVVILENY